MNLARQRATSRPGMPRAWDFIVKLQPCSREIVARSGRHREPRCKYGGTLQHVSFPKPWIPAPLSRGSAAEPVRPACLARPRNAVRHGRDRTFEPVNEVQNRRHLLRRRGRITQGVIRTLNSRRTKSALTILLPYADYCNSARTGLRRPVARLASAAVLLALCRNPPTASAHRPYHFSSDPRRHAPSTGP